MGCVYFGRILFRGSLKGNLRASSGIVAGECALFSPAANQEKRAGEKEMNYGETNLGLLSALRLFGDAVNSCRADNAVLPWGPMLPYVYPRYGENANRYFYIGRDTYGWDLGSGVGFGDFFAKYDAGDLSGYLRMNGTALTTEKRINCWSGYTGSFWHVVNMLHLRLRQGVMPNMGELTTEQIALLDEIGYGNLNSIELPVTLQKQECWDDIDQGKYETIKWASDEYLNRYALVHDTFKPTVSIITTWSGDEGHYFKGLNYNMLAEETRGKIKIAVYLVKNGCHTSIVVWTYHPSYLPRIHISCEDFVECIAKVVEKYQGRDLI